MNAPLTGLFAFGGLAAIMWGGERYRSHFAKRDLAIGVGVGTGFLLLAVAPAFYDAVGALLSLDSRFVTTSLFGNLFLIVMVFYLYTTLRDTQRDISDLSRSLSVTETMTEPRTDGGNHPIAIVIPAYNEAASIESVLEALPDKIRGYPIEAIVVSDGSNDDTATRAAEAGATVAEHPINQGQGGALRTGFLVAEEKNAEVIVTMDADGQHPVDELENLVAPVLDDEADYVMGSRYRGVDHSGNGVVRKSGIKFFTWLINRLTKSEITDCTNGYRAIRGSEIGKLTLTEERFSAPELIIEARKNGMQIEEIPIVIQEREAGETKKPQLGYALGLTRTVLMTWIR
ncbi:glycosyl transferase family 2 [Halorubrum sp. C3]|nr:glycosyl transferase family 2 [Halorubrum sp. C3]